jgi:hypothetical protein
MTPGSSGKRRSGIALLVLATLALPGCLSSPGSGSAFGPAGPEGSDTLADGGPGWPVSLKAKPARGAVPLEVLFSLQVAGAPPDLPWRARFGDGEVEDDRGASASFTHVYTAVGSHEVEVTVGTGPQASRSTLTITALPQGTPADDADDDEVEGTTAPSPDDQGEGEDEAGGTDDGGPGSDAGGGEGSGAEGGDGEDREDDEQEGGDGSGSGSGSSTGPSTTASTSSRPPPSSTTSSSRTSSTTSPPPPPPPSATTTSTTGSTSSSPSPTPSPSPSPSPSPAPTPPPNQMPDASLDADPYGGEAPVDITYTVRVSDPDGDALQWSLTVDGVQVGQGTEDGSPWTYTKRYEEPRYSTAVLVVSDGGYTVRREVTVRVYEGPL